MATVLGNPQPFSGVNCDMKLTLAMIAAIVLACVLSGTALAVAAAKCTGHDRSTTTVVLATEILRLNAFQGDEQIVDWDPISCWDCARSDETLALFLAGLIMLAPIMILARLARTRRNHAKIVKRILGHCSKML